MSSLCLCDKDLTIFRILSRSCFLYVTSHFYCPSSRDRRWLLNCPSTIPYSLVRFMRSFSTLFALVLYSACNMAFVDAGVSLTGSVHADLKIFPFLIYVLISLPHSTFMLRYAVVTCSHSKNRSPLFPSPQSNLTSSVLIDLLVPAKASL